MGEDNTVAIVAIAVSGGVGLIAAVVAPIAAHFRQRRALIAESERQERQLAHAFCATLKRHGLVSMM